MWFCSPAPVKFSLTFKARPKGHLPCNNFLDSPIFGSFKHVLHTSAPTTERWDSSQLLTPGPCGWTLAESRPGGLPPLHLPGSRAQSRPGHGHDSGNAGEGELQRLPLIIIVSRICWAFTMCPEVFIRWKLREPSKPSVWVQILFCLLEPCCSGKFPYLLDPKFPHL